MFVIACAFSSALTAAWVESIGVVLAAIGTITAVIVALNQPKWEQKRRVVRDSESDASHVVCAIRTLPRPADGSSARSYIRLDVQNYSPSVIFDLVAEIRWPG